MASKEQPLKEQLTAEEVEDQHNDSQPHKLISDIQVDLIWNSPDPVQEIFEIFTSFFNPEHDPEFEQVDDNTIRFLAEFQIYNLIFLKNDLKLQNDQIALILDMLWNILGVTQDGSLYDGSIPAEGNFHNAISDKFEEVKNHLVHIAKQGILSKEQIKEIMNFLKLGYFKNFRLIDFVLRNRQMPTVKNIVLFHDEPIRENSLDQAKEVVDEQQMNQHYEGEGEIGHDEHYEEGQDYNEIHARS